MQTRTVFWQTRGAAGKIFPLFIFECVFYINKNFTRLFLFQLCYLDFNFNFKRLCQTGPQLVWATIIFGAIQTKAFTAFTTSFALLPIKSFYLVIIFTFLSNLLEFGNYTQACKVHRGAAQSFLTCLKAHISGFMQCATSS